MSRAVIITGGNALNSEECMLEAERLLVERAGPVVLRSDIKVSAPWGDVAACDAAGILSAGAPDPEARAADFLNQILCIDTCLTALELLSVTQHIEIELGRVRPHGYVRTEDTRSKKYYSRPIDIDILFYDDAVIDEQRLKIPHPLLHEREFVLLPLREIMPGFVHPVLKKTVSELYDNIAGKI